MKNKIMLFGIFMGIVIIAASAILLFSCGGTGGAQTGTVALYLTDDISDFQQVTATITRVQVVHTGSNASCDILSTPVTIDITDLANVMHLVNVEECPAAPYNRLHIEFEKTVELTDKSGASSTCAFTTYKDEGNRPNAIQCDPGTNICFLDMTGAINVFANAMNKIALDFDLKEFEVELFDDPGACSVTMKVSPLHAAAMGHMDRPESISGSISDLDTDGKTFILTRGRTILMVDYSGIDETQQPGLSALLQLAVNDRLRVKVASSGIDLGAGSISASAVYVKVEGTVSNLDPAAQTFSLTYKMNRMITVFYGPPARVKGVITDTAWVEVKLYGYDSANSRYLAYQVELESGKSKPGYMTDN